MKNKYYDGPQSDHFDGQLFFNPWDRQTTPSFMKVLYWKLTAGRKHWPVEVENTFSDRPPDRVEGSQLRVCFVGHSTVLIQTEGLNILTDPVWAHRVSPFKNFGPTRVRTPGILLHNLPPIDLILISHNHYDHLDLETLKQIELRDSPQIFTPLGNDKIIKREIPSIKVETLDWHQHKEVTSQLKIHLMPSQHWSARGFLDRNKALWGAFVISTPGGHIYFCGDSGYGSGEIFRKVHEEFGNFRLALLPIGAYEPRWFMEYAHMNPEEAVHALKDLDAAFGLAIHFETFRLTDEGFDDPRNHLTAACEKYSIAPKRFRSLQVGEAWLVP